MTLQELELSSLVFLAVISIFIFDLLVKILKQLRAINKNLTILDNEEVVNETVGRISAIKKGMREDVMEDPYTDCWLGDPKPDKRIDTVRE